jgi:small subunit ribosomal protein S8
MSIDRIGDFLTIIRNATLVHKRTVTLPASKLKLDIAKVLKDEGYIWDFSSTQDEAGKNTMTVRLKYKDGESVIHEITRLSKPGRRRYQQIKRVKPFRNGYGITILTTNKGVVSDRVARELAVGGEVLCRVF